jgi:DNA-binding NarL/FixJ family response regulator
MKPSIIIADDHPLLLKGLQDFLIEKNHTIIGSASNGKEAYKLIIKHEPDIAILDIRMPFMSGIEIAKLCKDKVQTKIILITFERNSILYHQAKELNVFGYLLKEFALSEIENCLNSVFNDIPYFSPEIENYFSEKPKNLNIEILTPAEKRVLKLIAQNKTAKEIGEQFTISRRTVEKHKSNIVKKLNIDSHPNSLLIWVKENQDYLL